MMPMSSTRKTPAGLKDLYLLLNKLVVVHQCLCELMPEYNVTGMKFSTFGHPLKSKLYMCIEELYNLFSWGQMPIC